MKEKLSSNYGNRTQNIRIPDIVIKCFNPPENVAIFLTLELKLRRENDTTICIKKKKKKMKNKVLATKWFLLKDLYRKAHTIFVGFVTVPLFDQNSLKFVESFLYLQNM